MGYYLPDCDLFTQIKELFLEVLTGYLSGFSGYRVMLWYALGLPSDRKHKELMTSLSYPQSSL
jgi:hypothetical protein